MASGDAAQPPPADALSAAAATPQSVVLASFGGAVRVQDPRINTRPFPFGLEPALAPQRPPPPPPALAAQLGSASQPTLLSRDAPAAPSLPAPLDTASSGGVGGAGVNAMSAPASTARSGPASLYSSQPSTPHGQGPSSSYASTPSANSPLAAGPHPRAHAHAPAVPPLPLLSRVASAPPQAHYPQAQGAHVAHAFGAAGAAHLSTPPPPPPPPQQQQQQQHAHAHAHAHAHPQAPQAPGRAGSDENKSGDESSDELPLSSARSIHSEPFLTGRAASDSAGLPPAAAASASAAVATYGAGAMEEVKTPLAVAGGGGLAGGESEEMRELARRRAEQQRRRELITAEQNNVQLSAEKEDAYWEKQDQRFKHLVERTANAQRTAEELHQYLAKGTKVLNGFAEAVLAQGSWGSKEIGTLRQAAIAHDTLRNSIYEHYSEMKEKVFSESVNQAVQLARATAKRTVALQQAGQKTGKTIRMHRDRVAETWKEYQRLVAERQRLELADRPVSRDPFLACRVYERAMAELEEVEANYNKDMSSLFLELRVEDGRRIDQIKVILLDYLLAQKALLEHTVKFTESAIAAVKAIDRERDVNEFISHADLLVHPPRRADGSKDHAAQVTSIFELPPPGRSPATIRNLHRQEVVHEGKLLRPGKIFKSNWKEIFVAVSAAGFFHYFDDQMASAPALSLALHECQVAAAPSVDKLAFEIAEPNRSFFSFAGSVVRHVFKAASDEDFGLWMGAMRRFAPAQSAAAAAAAPAAPISPGAQVADAAAAAPLAEATAVAAADAPALTVARAGGDAPVVSPPTL
jgi:hypothetical protein